jgi:hypothetical protein
MHGNHEPEQSRSLWNLAAATIARTFLSFSVPYLLAYYCIMAAWEGARPLLSLLVRVP